MFDSFFFFSFSRHDLFIRELRHADKNRTGPDKLLYEDIFSTFKFFCGQDIGHISHVGFTVITPHGLPFLIFHFVTVISSNLIPRKKVSPTFLNLDCRASAHEKL